MFTPLLFLATLAAPALAATSGDCRPLRRGVAPTPTPNTPEAFASFNYYDVVANSTVAEHPGNYENFLVAGNAALHDDDAYVAYKELKGYDVGACARECDLTGGCASFNIYFQRHPSLAPGPACPNPEANIVVRCALFNAPMSAAQATNHGQQRGPADAEGDRFEVLMRGSNAYNRLISPNKRVTVTATTTVSATKTVTNVVTKMVRVE
ncbi:hypothetical protein BU25DRAFT_444923 [Macroventuria anomochaeta]|uniref:Uncharacterized protein n=1 Tax=Macroventuria anomochaeta TaxID=301207 RepID=A0ACB6SI09_9PLEO|nr:uncharacterized protein BU25DRAFT_444923 [Macroventuria anomochaeta]KAF2632924.1 hypothetical protein BU25DRAFT_444923 [Macroventuria anomochaeta]